MSAVKDFTGFGRQLNLPLVGRDFKDLKRPTGTQPAFTHFFKVPDAMNDVSLGVLLGEVEEVNGADSMCNIDDDVTNLLQPVRAFVHPQQLRNG